MSTFSELSMTDITGEEVSFDKYDGTVCLVVNVASR
jgi:glutathione peroxidase-family protein